MLSKSLSGLFQNVVSDRTTIKDEMIVSGFELLKNNRINTPENQEAICSCPQYAVQIALGLHVLNDNKILTEQNRFRVCANAKNAENIAEAIVILSEADIYDLSTWLLVAKYPESASAIASVFGHLKEAGIRTEENQTKICNIASFGFANKSSIYRDAERIALAIPFLNRDKFRELFTQEVYDKLCLNPKDAIKIINNINNTFDLPKSNKPK